MADATPQSLSAKMSDSPSNTSGCPTGIPTAACVTLAHGGGGAATQDLVEGIFLRAFASPLLDRRQDAAVLDVAAADGRLAVTTDAFVVRPRFFPGGSLGELAVHGTVNDLAMQGATPRWLTAGFILEEGLPLAELTAIVERMAAAARAAGVVIAAGDTKVVERGHGDGLYVITTGIGIVPPEVRLGEPLEPGDAVLVSGPIGDHGMAIMSVREGLEFEAAIESDTAPLHGLVASLLAACPSVRLLRDPTRGGVAASLNEMAALAGAGIEIDETAVPVRPVVAAACEILGLDPLQVANEGRLLAIVPAAMAPVALAALRAHEHGRGATQLGRIVAAHPGVVVMRTAIGGTRVVPLPIGEQLPRIC
jgi:hydrogenase expression/formation protein HypE